MPYNPNDPNSSEHNPEGETPHIPPSFAEPESIPEERCRKAIAYATGMNLGEDVINLALAINETLMSHRRGEKTFDDIEPIANQFLNVDIPAKVTDGEALKLFQSAANGLKYRV